MNLKYPLLVTLLYTLVVSCYIVIYQYVIYPCEVWFAMYNHKLSPCTCPHLLAGVWPPGHTH